MYMLPRISSFLLMIVLILVPFRLFAQEETSDLPVPSEELTPTPSPEQEATPPVQENTPPERQPEAPPPIISEWIFDNDNAYRRGDRTFLITFGFMFPTVFGGAVENNNHNMKTGGSGTLAFNQFLTSNIFVGGELSGMFASTVGKNTYTVLPAYGLKLGYQFVLWRFEFPLSFFVGAGHQRRRPLEDAYYGPIFKPSASVFWRFNQEWSFGLNTVWWLIPQWPAEREGFKHNVYGNFLELTLSARFHF